MKRSERRKQWKTIETLKGLSQAELRQFSWDNLDYFFKVSLWDKSHLCAGCGKEIMSIIEATLDHILPRALGGRTRLANLQLMHRDCNGKKGKKLTNGWPKNWRKLQTPVSSRSDRKWKEVIS